jgi:5-formyltetrahydrofolate cyclo-ligase
MGENKNKLRAAILSRRRSLSTAEVLRLSQSIQKGALELAEYLGSHSVALYSPTENEVATEQILNHAIKQRKNVFYPKLGRQDSVRLVRIKSPAELQRGSRGILEPAGEEGLSQKDEDGLLVFVPGVAFDKQGNRLGRGIGWYDRLLHALGQKITAVALAYEFQIVEEVPAEVWDRTVHTIVTERRTIDCRKTLFRPIDFSN